MARYSDVFENGYSCILNSNDKSEYLKISENFHCVYFGSKDLFVPEFVYLNFGCNLILNLACGGGKYASIRIFNTSWLGIIIVVIMSFIMLLSRLLTFKKNKFIKFI